MPTYKLDILLYLEKYHHATDALNIPFLFTFKLDKIRINNLIHLLDIEGK